MNRNKLTQVCQRITIDSRMQLWKLQQQFLESPTSGMQMTFDLSTWDCNKPNIATAMQIINIPAIVDWTKIDTDSQRRLSVLYKPGTILVPVTHHDKHDYPLNEPCMVIRHVGEKRTNKIYMTALRLDGTEGSYIYVYDLFRLVFTIEDAMATEFFAKLQTVSDLQAQKLLKELEASEI